MQPAFGWRLGSSVQARSIPLHRALRPSLGFTPTGATPPTECTQYGTRMIEEQGGYAAILCPVAPDCHDIIDAITGQVVVAKVKGSAPWVNICEQYGYTNPNPDAVIPTCDAGKVWDGRACVELPKATKTPETTETPEATPPQQEPGVPLSIDIQAFTPGGTGPIPVSNYAQQPPPQAQAPAKQQPLPPAPEEKTAGSELANVGIAAGLVAAGAFALSMFK